MNDLEYELPKGYNLNSCAWNPTELCEVPDTDAEPTFTLCYDLTGKDFPTNGASWTYNGTEQLDCTGGLGGARSELLNIRYGV